MVERSSKRIDEGAVDANGILQPGAVGRGKPPEREVALAVEYLKQCKPVKSPRKDSYGFKHEIENWYGTYISNGAAIVAALRLGFPVKHIPSTPNCLIGVSAKERPRVKERLRTARIALKRL